jgi:chemosensory pili system protein ChpA (sensor histidine kinase/response regulator)
MSAITEFDVGPLTWVKNEIDLALNHARESLEQFADGLADRTHLRHCLTHLHQVSGAIQMVGLEGVARYSAEMEKLVEMLDKQELEPSAAHVELLKRAIATLSQYLAELVGGEPNQPLKLFPAYRELLHARGVERVSESELFFPDLSIRAPKNPNPKQAADDPAFVKKQRAKFQRGLLRWLRNEGGSGTDGLIVMEEALQAIDQAQVMPVHRTFWWAAVAFVDSLINQGLTPEFNVKQLCARIDLQMRRLAEGSQKVAERLLRDVLYFVAKSNAQTGPVSEVKEAFELEAYLPPVPRTEAEETRSAKLAPVIRELRDTLSAAKESWLKYTSGNKDSLTHFGQQTAKLADKANALEHAELSGLIDKVAAIAQSVGDLAAPRRDGVAMEMATALLLIENTLENFFRLTPEFAQQSEVQARRLQAAADGTLGEAELPEVPLLDEMSRKAQEKILLAQVVHEIQNNLRHVEQVLDTFFRDHSKREELTGIESAIHQIAGALTILDLPKAVELLNAGQQIINRFGAADYIPEQRELELVADALSSLGFYVEAIQYGRADAEKAIEPVWRKLTGKPAETELAAPVEEEESAPEASVESGLAAKKKELKELLSRWQQQPDDAQSRKQLEDALADLRQDADLIADAELNEQSAKALELLAKSGQAPEESLANAIAEMSAPKVQAVAPSEQTTRLLEATEEAVDAELLETYLEEAQEVLERVQENLALSREHPHDREALTTIRRGFHTLKGSGRMVGLTTLGEVAWAIEQVMNKWLEEERTATPALLDLISLAHDSFAQWVEHLSTQGSVEVDADELVAMAEQLRRGEAEPPGAEGEPQVAAEEAAQPVELPVAANEEEAPGEIALGAVVGETEISLAEAEALPVAEREGAAVPVPEIELPPVEPFEEAAATVVEAEMVVEPLAQDAEQLAEVEAEYEAEADIVIGETRVAPALFAIFLKEAEQHLQTLRTEYENACAEPEAPIAHEFMRAAHTLCGIARTTGFPVLAELGYALEQLLFDHLEHQRRFGDEHVRVTGEAVSGLERMLRAIEAKQQPAPATETVIELEQLLRQVVAEREAAAQASAADALAAEQAVIPTGPPEVSEPVAVEAIVAERPIAVEAVHEQPTEAEEETERRVIQDDLDDQLLPIFLEESQELFPMVGSTLRDWREEPSNMQHPQSLQRTLHTIKGSARMAGAMRLGELTHNMETLVITALESGELAPTLFDELESWQDRLGEALDRLQRGEAAAVPVPEKPQAVETEVEAAPAEKPRAPVRRPAEPLPTFGEVEQAAQKAFLRVRADVVDRLVNEAGEVSIARSRIEGEMLAFKQSLLDLTENIIRLRNQLREVEIQAESQMQSRMSLVQDDDVEFDPLEFDRFTRFQELTRMMAESVNDVSTVQQNLLKNLDESEAALLQQSRMTRELQQELMHIRMVPLDSVAERLYRIVRQTAKELGKKANLEIRGANVEMDRSVLEKMTAPFEHLLRNAIGHGLEDAAGRTAAGKSEIGEMQLEAGQQGNEIVLRFRDDGKGIDLAAVRAKAERLGLLEPGAEITDTKLMEFIFAPGFSTADQVTQVSGRGVGMDVVRNEVAGLGGRIEVASEAGKGTLFTIYLPLTLAVTQAVLVTAGTDTYALPSSMVEQVQELKADKLAELYERHEVEWLGRHYPFAYLPRLLGDHQHNPAAKVYNSVLLLRSGEQTAAIHVDELIGTREIVVKNIGPQLARVPGVAGATVLGDGRIVLILNPVQLTYREAEIPIVTAKAVETAMPVVEQKPSTAPIIMVVDDSLTVRKITSRLLSREGYEVITAKDGVEALQELQESKPTVMLVDIEMPRMDGFELTKNVRGDANTANIPIIMITSRTAEKHRNYAKELGVDVYLGKPYQEEELLGYIESFVKGERKH